MSKNPVYPLIFTDLDGTLLDHESYSAKPADLLIQQINRQSIGAIIPVTSKTRAELAALQKSVPLGDAISVTENGSVIHLPLGYPNEGASDPVTVRSGIAYAEILHQINALPQKLRQHITGFSDMSEAEVSKATGLRLRAARLAKDREASEPFLWSGSEAALQELGKCMADARIRMQRGGRFYHLTGDATKQQAMACIKSEFAKRKPEADVLSVALGDGPNDLGMIEAADIGVIMPNPEGVSIHSSKSHVRMAPAPGPRGWVIAVRDVFAELGLILTES